MLKRAGILSVVALILLAAGCERFTEPVGSKPDEFQATDNILPSGTPIEGQFIVVLNKQDVSLGKSMVAMSTLARTLLEENEITDGAIGAVYTHALEGFTAKLTEEDVDKLLADPRVAYIEQDKIITLAPPLGKGKPPKDDGESAPQVTPWGITRIGDAGNGTGKTAWVIDTGIDLTQADLNVDVNRSANFVPRGRNSPNDGHGHGTHVAGTIAAVDNDIGVVGVAAGATLVAVRVLDNSGRGAYSWVIAGVDYVAAKASAGDVANLSLGGPPSNALDDAVRNAAAGGLRFSLAAGNSGDDAKNYSPARVEATNVYTVSAIGNDDCMPSWSNWGNPPVEYAAPGVSILSTKKGGGTTTMSGTSMAAPHVAGLLLLSPITADGTACNDPDGNPDPIAHR